MSIIHFLVPETAPFASGRGENMSFVKLNILNWMSQAKFVNSHASCSVTSDLYDRHSVNEDLSVRTVSFQGELKKQNEGCKMNVTFSDLPLR